MAREKEGFRQMLDRLDEKYPNKEVLSQPELAAFIGCSTKFLQMHWKPHYNKMLNGYSKVKIASVLVN